MAAINRIVDGLDAEVHLHCCHSVYKRQSDVIGDYKPILPRLKDAKIDRVNLEIQILRARMSFSKAVRQVWLDRLASEALGESGAVARALFGTAVVRYVTRAMSYPELYRPAEPEYRRALQWLAEN